MGLPLIQNYFQQVDAFPRFFTTLWVSSSFLTFLSVSVCLSSSGTTHSFSNPGGLWVWVCGFPRAPLSGPNSLSPAGSASTIRLWCWAFGRGGSRGGQDCGIRSPPGKHLSMDHHLQSPSGGLYVGEYLWHTVGPTALKLLPVQSKHTAQRPCSQFGLTLYICLDQHSEWVLFHIHIWEVSIIHAKYSEQWHKSNYYLVSISACYLCSGKTV